jgi:hypothetical protein
MLGRTGNDKYAMLLYREYVFLKKKYGLQPPHCAIHFLRMRPVNFPPVKLAQLAMLIHRSSHLFSKIIEETSPQYILSFGTGDGTELFTMGNNEGRKYLNAPSLEEMMYDTDASKQLKRKTWNELKLFFGIT